jgi:threonine dehydrogenase-like Zn-dependent dehydrogenase
MYTAGDVRVEEREDPKIIDPTDGIIRLTATCICGSDLWPYRGIEPADHQVMRHEYVGVVEEVGAEVKNVKVGDFVVGSFVISHNTCEICQSGFQSKCVHAEFVSQIGTQATKARIPYADGTLVATPGQPDPELIPSLLAASDVLGTGWFDRPADLRPLHDAESHPCNSATLPALAVHGRSSRCRARWGSNDRKIHRKFPQVV